MDEATLARIKQQLESERATVEKRLADQGATIEGDQVDMPQGGFADSAQVTAERSELLSLVEGLQKTHAEIVGALGRIADGTYGRCARCGNEISPERLEAMPRATLCVNCKRSAA
jgi:RNA polymerase-binding protein DksA